MRTHVQLSLKRLWLGRHEPDAMRDPDGEHRDTPDMLNKTLHGSKSMRHATNKRQTVEDGMKRTLSKMILFP